MVKCECCGNDFFGRHIKCPSCGEDVFAKSLAKKYERKLYDDNIIMECRNCKFLRRENGAGAVAYYCIKNLDKHSSEVTYRVVDFDDSCTKFVYFKDTEIK